MTLRFGSRRKPAPVHTVTLLSGKQTLCAHNVSPTGRLRLQRCALQSAQFLPINVGFYPFLAILDLHLMKDAVVCRYHSVPRAARTSLTRSPNFTPCSPRRRRAAHSGMAAPAAAPPRSTQRSPHVVATATSRHSASVAAPPRRSDWTSPLSIGSSPRLPPLSGCRGGGEWRRCGLRGAGVVGWFWSLQLSVPSFFTQRLRELQSDPQRRVPRVKELLPRVHQCTAAAPPGCSAATAQGTKRHPRRGIAALRPDWEEQCSLSDLNAS